MGNVKRVGNITQGIQAGTIIMVVLALSCLGSAATGGEELPLHADPGSWDGGTIPEGTFLDLDFLITNTGSEDIKLNYIHAECDCTLTVPASGLVPAGGSFLLQVQLHVHEFGEGPLDEAITLLTNHPRQSSLRIPVTAWVTAAGSDSS